MKRLALVKDGKVQNVVLVHDNQVNDYPVPEGHTAHVSETAGVDDHYDGHNFVRPPASIYTLTSHAGRRFYDHAYSRHDAGGGFIVEVDQMNHDFLSRLAAKARHDSTVSTPWVHWRDDGSQNVFMLNAQQIIALDDAVTRHSEARQRAWAGVVQAIKDGVITTDYGVDHPPAHLPQWPPRFDQSPI